MTARILEIHTPEYNLDAKPDYLNIGEKVDTEIGASLPDGRYLYRAIGKDDHPKFSVNDLVDIILKSGTDKYDPERKEVCFDEFCMYDHDIQAGSFKIKDHKIISNDSNESMFGDTIKKFYENVLLDRGYRVRIDILIIYDADKFLRAQKIKERIKSVRSELEACLYKFKDPKNKREALVEIVKILR
jgi:hypothetical protein